MQIKDLPSTSTVNSTDLLVKEQSNGTTEKIAIGDFVVNNLTRDATKVPSAECVYDSVAKYAHFNVTIPSTAGGVSSGFPLPTGFTRANCIIENVSVPKFSGSNIYFQDTLANDGVTFVFVGDSVTVITSSNTPSSWLGETATVYLQSIV